MTASPRAKVHADPSNVTLNMWTTPDEANLDPTGGGLVVYKARYPEGWSWHEHNSYTDNKVRTTAPSGQAGGWHWSVVGE